jgi:uncharacterized protein YecE (DUF72 family)
MFERLSSTAMNLYLGTSGWAYGTWKPEFYPHGLGAKSFLAHYATKFNSVEVNYTFGSPRKLTPELAAKWIDAVPENFKFSFKAPRQVTHSRERLQHSEPLKAFLQTLRPFQKSDKMACILFQLPPTLRCDTRLLGSFLKRWRGSVPAAFEFRHASWFNDQIFGILRDANVALCVAESDELQTPDIATTNFVYYRFRLSEYPAAALRKRAEYIAAHMRGGREVFAYQKHEESAITPKRASAIQRSVAKILSSAMK